MTKQTSLNEKSEDEVLQDILQHPKFKEVARDEFLSTMSHDLRTPLNAVIGFAQIIENEMYGKVNPHYREYAKHIQESGLDLLSKIEDLLHCPAPEGPRRELAEDEQNEENLVAAD